MQQRRLRLGDILDDYCPRERRITNHVIVAMIDEQVKQTRCSTCDADHEYKGGRAPTPRRKKDARDAPDVEQPADDMPLLDESPAEMAEAEAAAGPQLQADGAAEDVDTVAEEQREDDGPVHRRLIRATLPRPEGQPPDRKEPEFTIRQQGGRGREFDGNRAGGGGGQQRHGRGRRAMRGGGGGGQGQPGGPSRFGGPRQNGPQGPRQKGSRPGPQGGGGERGGGRPQGQRGPGRKRGR